jgi:aspartyl-tRNA synthetase
VAEALKCALELKPRQVGFIVAAYEDLALGILGRVRVELARRLLRLDPKQFEFLWVVDFPLFLAGADGIESAHHPFTAPVPEDAALLRSDPLRVRGLHYDLVLNGQEVAGGSIRIHDAQMQEFVLRDILQTDCSELQHLLAALGSGCPPHGGIALGLDRYISILTNSKSIRDVIAFPKGSDGKDSLSGAPVQISEREKKLYHLEIVKDE